jgi:hypothetical protein
MLNDKKPNGNARMIYKNDIAKQDLEIEFNHTVILLIEFNS